MSKRYVLERTVRTRSSGRTSRCWQRQGLCGNRTLLEQIRAGQKKPDEWRIRPWDGSDEPSTGKQPQTIKIGKEHAA